MISKGSEECREWQVTLFYAQSLSIEDAESLIDHLAAFGAAVAVGSESETSGAPDAVTLAVNGRMPVGLETALKAIHAGGLEAEPFMSEIRSWAQVEAEEETCIRC